MKRLCGWCDKTLGEKEPLEDKSVTHGICEACGVKLLAKPARFRDTTARQFRPPIAAGNVIIVDENERTASRLLEAKEVRAEMDT